jgi:ribonuclease P protein component
VTRNKVRRRLREIVYPRLSGLDRAHDLAFVARGAAARASYVELEAAVQDLMGRARLVQP